MLPPSEKREKGAHRGSCIGRLERAARDQIDFMGIETFLDVGPSLCKEFDYVTVMREPMARLLSHLRALETSFSRVRHWLGYSRSKSDGDDGGDLAISVAGEGIVSRVTTIGGLGAARVSFCLFSRVLYCLIFSFVEAISCCRI
jgi:hypothetical protein